MAVIILNKSPEKSKKKYVQGSVINDPKSIEWNARRKLRKMIEPMKLEINDVIEDLRKNDRDAREVGQRLEAIKKKHESQFEFIAESMSKDWVNSVNRYNRNQMIENLRDALGIDASTIISEDIKEDLEMMMYESALYIKTIPSELVFRVSDRVLQHYKGIPMPENRTLSRQIKEEFKISDGRAKVIARDQTSKMNTSISAIRQREIGIDMYVWETMKDERVVGKPGGLYKKINSKHKNHYIMQGKLCKWEDPTVYSDDKGKTWKKRTEEMPHNHPGDDIMCRCRPAPYIDIESLKVKWAE